MNRYFEDSIRVRWNATGQHIEAYRTEHQVAFPQGEQPTLSRILDVFENCPTCVGVENA